MENYEILCPRCKREDIQFEFIGNNTYFAGCKTCKRVIFYCAIFQKLEYFKVTKDRYDMDWQKFTQRKGVPVEVNSKKHDWDVELIKQFGNARCKKCGMQFEYYQRNLATLNAWTKEDIESDKEHYDKAVKSYEECVSRH